MHGRLRQETPISSPPPATKFHSSLQTCIPLPSDQIHLKVRRLHNSNIDFAALISPLLLNTSGLAWMRILTTSIGVVLVSHNAMADCGTKTPDTKYSSKHLELGSKHPKEHDQWDDWWLQQWTAMRLLPFLEEA
jgi:hypothetical protein